jgi:endoglucanase
MGSLFIALAISIFTSCDKNTTEEPVKFSVSPDSVVFDAGGETKQFKVTASSNWNLTNTADWVEASQSSGNGSATVDFTALENVETEIRRVVVTFTSQNESKEVVLIQSPKDTLNGFKFDVEPDQTGMRLISMQQLASEMKAGWNVGNSLEAIGGETNWGNPLISKRLIDSVKAAGFNMIRIPVAWSVFSDESYYIIEESWLNRVEEVVNYVLDNDMYAMINIHWDNGWMQPTYDQQNYVNDRLERMWKQIATHFRDYGDHLLFAGTNEVMKDGDYGTPTKEYYTVQNSFNQTFITAARKTGGKNVFRYLVVQGFNTNIDHAVNFAKIPDDVVEDRMLMEIHYYDPYNFALNENSNISQWGSIATDPSLTETWANESYVDNQFNKMKTNFIDKGIGVILGEYGAIARTNVEGHEVFRKYYLEYITQSAVNSGLTPVYWDNGYTGNHAFGLFDRATGTQAHPELIEVIVKPFE